MKYLLLTALLVMGAGCAIAQAQGDAANALSEIGMWPGVDGNPAEPNANLTLGTLAHTLDAPTFNAHFAPEDSRAPLVRNPALVDYEYENFTSPGFAGRGSSHTLRMEQGLYLDNKTFDVGIRGSAQYIALTALNLMGTKNAAYGDWSIAPGAYIEKTFQQSMDTKLMAGGALDLILYDGTFASQQMYGTRMGGQVSIYGRAAKWTDIHSFVGGALLQEAYAGNITQTNLGLSAQWQAAVLPNVSTQVSALYKYLLMQNITNIPSSAAENSSELRLSVGAIFWVSGTLGLEASYRATLLIDQLDMNAFVLKTRCAF